MRAGDDQRLIGILGALPDDALAELNSILRDAAGKGVEVDARRVASALLCERLAVVAAAVPALPAELREIADADGGRRYEVSLYAPPFSVAVALRDRSRYVCECRRAVKLTRRGVSVAQAWDSIRRRFPARVKGTDRASPFPVYGRRSKKPTGGSGARAAPNPPPAAAAGPVALQGPARTRRAEQPVRPPRFNPPSFVVVSDSGDAVHWLGGEL